MLSHIIRQVSEYKCPLPGLIDRGTAGFDVVTLPVDIDLLPFVIDDVSGRHHSTIAHVEMEQSQQIVHILSRQEIWNFQWQIEPSRHTDLRVSPRCASIVWNILLHLHVNLVSMWIEIKHNGLFCKPVLVVYFGCDVVQILINGLFYIENI